MEAESPFGREPAMNGFDSVSGKAVLCDNAVLSRRHSLTMQNPDIELKHGVSIRAELQLKPYLGLCLMATCRDRGRTRSLDVTGPPGRARVPGFMAIQLTSSNTRCAGSASQASGSSPPLTPNNARFLYYLPCPRFHNYRFGTNVNLHLAQVSRS